MDDLSSACLQFGQLWQWEESKIHFVAPQVAQHACRHVFLAPITRQSMKKVLDAQKNICVSRMAQINCFELQMELDKPAKNGVDVIARGVSG